jgi:hypothetical protein
MVVSLRLVEINNFNVYRPGRMPWPFEAYAPLAIDPDRILPLSIFLTKTASFCTAGSVSCELSVIQRSPSRPKNYSSTAITPQVALTDEWVWYPH